MFQFFRRQDALVRWFLGGLLVLICLTMVITLIPGAGQGGAGADPTVVATVCGAPISAEQVRQQFQEQTRGRNVPDSLFATFAPTILKNLMDEKAMDCEAHRVGLETTEPEVAGVLRTNATFFPGGQFIGAERYRELIETQLQITVEQFEDDFRGSILRSKLRHLVTDPVSVNDADADREYHQKNDKIKVDYVVLQATQFVSDVKMDETDIQAFFERTKENFRLPERRKVKYAILDISRIKDSVPVTPDDLRTAYESNRGGYQVKERVHIAQIVVPTKDLSADQLKEKQKKMDDLLARARKGDDFSELAKSSEDPQTKDKGGDMGWVSRGQATPEMEKVMFTLQPGQISDVIKSAIGLHIIKVIAHEPAHTRTLQEMQVELYPKVKAEKAQRAQAEVESRLEAAMRKNPKTLEALAAEMQMTIATAADFQRGGPLPALGASPAADDAIFALKKPGELSGAVTVGQQKAVFQLEEILPSRLPQMAEVRGRVEQDYKTAKSITLLDERAAEFGARLKALGDITKAAKEKKYEVKTSADLARDGRVDNFGGTADFPGPLFAMKVGDTGGPVAGSGKFFYQLKEINVASAEDAAKNRDKTREQLLEDKRAEYWDLFMADLRARLTKDGKMNTNDAVLKRLTGAVAP